MHQVPSTWTMQQNIRNCLEEQQISLEDVEQQWKQACVSNNPLRANKTSQ